MRGRVLLAAIVVGVAGVVGAQNLPDLGGTERSALSPLAERRIGEAIYRDIRRDASYVRDAEVSEYLNGLGAKLVAAGPSAPWEYEFFAMSDPAVNAFALPGGFIGVNTGLIRLTENESELASVVAHEVSHVTQHHIARMIGNQQQMQIPAMIAMAATILLANSRPDLAGAAAAISQAGAAQYQLNYTREFEREADRIGFQRLSAAGFDVHAMGTFFEKLQRSVRVADDGSVPGYLQSHPVSTERIAESQNRASSSPYRQHVDSLDYALVRAKLRAESGDAREALSYFADALRERRFANEAATRYGLIGAQLRAGQAAQAAEELARLRATGARSSMIEMLSARVKLARGDRNGALQDLRAALDRYPSRRAVVYAYAQELLEAGRAQDANALLVEKLRTYPRDAQLHGLQARSFSALGKRLLQHQAQAEAYYLEGSLPAAIDQLQIAQRSGDGDFYQLSAVEARLKQLRAERDQELRQSRR